jgi:hypothetical protein
MFQTIGDHMMHPSAYQPLWTTSPRAASRKATTRVFSKPWRMDLDALQAGCSLGASCPS